MKEEKNHLRSKIIKKYEGNVVALAIIFLKPMNMNQQQIALADD